MDVTLTAIINAGNESTGNSYSDVRMSRQIAGVLTRQIVNTVIPANGDIEIETGPNNPLGFIGKSENLIKYEDKLGLLKLTSTFASIADYTGDMLKLTNMGKPIVRKAIEAVAHDDDLHTYELKLPGMEFKYCRLVGEPIYGNYGVDGYHLQFRYGRRTELNVEILNIGSQDKDGNYYPYIDDGTMYATDIVDGVQNGVYKEPGPEHLAAAIERSINQVADTMQTGAKIITCTYNEDHCLEFRALTEEADYMYVINDLPGVAIIFGLLNTTNYPKMQDVEGMDITNLRTGETYTILKSEYDTVSIESEDPDLFEVDDVVLIVDNTEPANVEVIIYN